MVMTKKRENELIIHPIGPFRTKYESILTYVVNSSKNQIIFPAGKMVEFSLEVRGKRVCYALNIKIVVGRNSRLLF